MSSWAYYNEFDPHAAQWLRELIKLGAIAEGLVDERSIWDVIPSDLNGFTQCHFFAGIGAWSHALRNSGVSDDTALWTGSCPCQPFSSAGKGAGFADERHVWPAFHHLIRECRPELVFGEQVAGKGGEAWLDLVQDDLENEAYSCGATVTAACGVGAPHQRKRLYWVAENTLGHSHSERPHREHALLQREESRWKPQDLSEAAWSSEALKLADSSNSTQGSNRQTDRAINAGGVNHGRMPTNGHWRDVDWLHCTDGKWRAVEPRLEPLAYGAPSSLVQSGDLSTQDCLCTREGYKTRLKGYGNAIVAAQAQAFIEAYFDV